MARKILISDDDVSIREALKTPLLIRGYEVLEANNGFDGLRLARKEKPPIILQDILITKLDGMRVARLLKFDSRYKDIYLIAITQLARQETKDEARRVGFDDFFVKPLDPEVVADRIDAIYLKLEKK